MGGGLYTAGIYFWVSPVLLDTRVHGRGGAGHAVVWEVDYGVRSHSVK